jgi:serine/threonine protein phosphatase PrpC
MSNENKPLSIAVCGLSDVGLIRQNNEDSFLITDVTTGLRTADAAELTHAIGERGSLLIVADGMGGAEAGEVASQMAVDLVARLFFDQLSTKVSIEPETFVETLKYSVQEANHIVFEEGRANAQLKGMGTTLTAAAIHGESIFFAQLGDSRAYLIRNGFITQMTRDQSLVAQLVASGSLSPEEAKLHPQRNVILQALGVQPQVDVIISAAELRKGDRVVMCSDGLSGKLEAEEIKEVLETWLEPKTACQHLVQLARERGGEDNITVIVAAFSGDALTDPDPEDIPVYNNFQAKTRRRLWPWRKL